VTDVDSWKDLEPKILPRLAVIDLGLKVNDDLGAGLAQYLFERYHTDVLRLMQ
jgi:hypothetical protein